MPFCIELEAISTAGNCVDSQLTASSPIALQQGTKPLLSKSSELVVFLLEVLANRLFTIDRLFSLNDALLVIDTASLKIQDYNEAAKRYFSIKSDNLKALQFSNFFPEISPEELTEYLRLNAKNFSSDIGAL